MNLGGQRAAIAPHGTRHNTYYYFIYKCFVCFHPKSSFYNLWCIILYVCTSVWTADSVLSVFMCCRFIFTKLNKLIAVSESRCEWIDIQGGWVCAACTEINLNFFYSFYFLYFFWKESIHILPAAATAAAAAWELPWFASQHVLGVFFLPSFTIICCLVCVRCVLCVVALIVFVCVWYVWEACWFQTAQFHFDFNPQKLLLSITWSLFQVTPCPPFIEGSPSNTFIAWSIKRN